MTTSDPARDRLPALALRDYDPEYTEEIEALQRPALERAISRLPVPYTLACVVLAVLASPAGGLAIFKAESSSWDSAVAKSMAGFVPDTTWRLAVSLAGWTLVYLSMLIRVRNITRRVERAQNDLGPLLPGGITEYRRTLARLTNPVAPLVVGAVVVVASSQYYLAAVSAPETKLGWLVNMLHLALGVVIVGTSVWSTAVVWRAIHDIGRRELRLRPFEESSSLGLRPIGELSLAAAAVYFVPLGLLGLIATLTPAIPSMAAILAAFVAVGVVLFVLPLRGAHAHMSAEKGRRMSELRKVQLRTAFQVAGLHGGDAAVPGQGTAVSGELTAATTVDIAATNDGTGAPDEAAGPPEEGRQSFVDLATAMAMTNRLRALEISEQKLGAMHTWPVDTRILARLAALAVPITLAILTDAAKRFVFSR